MAATGNYLSFLDSDDLWMPDKLERQLDCFAADPSLDVVFGHARQFLCPRMTGRPVALAPVNLEPMPTQLPSAILVRRTAFFRVGLFVPISGSPTASTGMPGPGMRGLKNGCCRRWYFCGESMTAISGGPRGINAAAMSAPSRRPSTGAEQKRRSRG